MSDNLNEKTILKNLISGVLGNEFHIFQSLESTNEFAKKHITKNGAVILTEEQTAGKGLLGRTWVSPPKKSILMSVVLRPEKQLSMQLLNLAAGVSVAEMLHKLLNAAPALRWPNDVFVREKKICGILTESQFSGSSITKFVIGIGLNVSQNPEDFPENLRHPATSVQIETGTEVDRNALVSGILNNLDNLIHSIHTEDYGAVIERWKEYSDQIGKTVRVKQTDIEKIGLFQNITKDGGARIVWDDKSYETIYYGEIRTL